MTPYERIGGEAGVRAFTRRFYALMDTLPDAAPARAMAVPTSMASSRADTAALSRPSWRL